MYSLTICFGPTGTTWQFLFKELGVAVIAANTAAERKGTVEIVDDYGQTGSIEGLQIHGSLLEDLAAVETARIQRSLADERCKAKFIKAATDDPVIKSAMRPQGPSVLTPMGRMS